jgi:PPE-repeat protein
MCNVISVDDNHAMMASGKKAALIAEGKVWEWVTRTQNDVTKAVAPSSVQQLRILQDGYAGMASGTLCDVILVDDNHAIIASGKKAALIAEGKVWEWVTRTQNDATKAVAPSSVQQRRILKNGFAGMASGTLCDVVSVNDDIAIITSGKKATLHSEGTVWEWVQRPAVGAE